MPDAQSSFDLSKLIAEEDDPKRRVATWAHAQHDAHLMG